MEPDLLIPGVAGVRIEDVRLGNRATGLRLLSDASPKKIRGTDDLLS